MRSDLQIENDIEPGLFNLRRGGKQRPDGAGIAIDEVGHFKGVDKREARQQQHDKDDGQIDQIDFPGSPPQVPAYG